MKYCKILKVTIQEMCFNNYLLICSLFNDAVSTADYVLSINGMINEKLIGREVEGNSHSQIDLTFVWRD